MEIAGCALVHDPTCETYRIQQTILAKLKIWREWNDQRDELVRDAVVAGVPKRKIYEITGLARTTIDAITRADG